MIGNHISKSLANKYITTSLDSFIMLTSHDIMSMIFIFNCWSIYFYNTNIIDDKITYNDEENIIIIDGVYDYYDTSTTDGVNCNDMIADYIQVDRNKTAIPSFFDYKHKKETIVIHDITLPPELNNLFEIVFQIYTPLPFKKIQKFILPYCKKFDIKKDDIITSEMQRDLISYNINLLK